MTKGRMRRLLVVSPYGIGIRDLLLNEDLGRYLTKTFLLDLVTPIHIAETHT